MPPLRVAYLCEFSTLLGGERSLLTFLDHRRAADLEPVVVAPASGPLAAELESRGIERLDWPPGGRRDAEVLAPQLGARGVRIIHGNSLMVADATLALGVELGLPAVNHSRDIMTLSRARAKRLGKLTAVIAVSDAVAHWLRELEVAEHRIHRVHNAVDREALERDVRPGALRSELGIARDAPLIGCVGQIALRKGQDLFLEAAVRLAGRVADARFVIAGARYSRKEESVEYEAGLKSRAARPPLAGRVHFLGYRTDAPSVISALDVLVVPSRQEPLSRVLIEALALGVPSVATDVGGTREIIEDQRTGLLVRPEDPAALAAAALRLLTSPDLRTSIRQEGPRRARDFSPERQVKAIQSLYARVLKG